MLDEIDDLAGMRMPEAGSALRARVRDLPDEPSHRPSLAEEWMRADVRMEVHFCRANMLIG